jgi:hypothetical protein
MPPRRAYVYHYARRYAPERERAALLELVGGEGGRGQGAGGSAGGVIDLRYLPCDWALALPDRTALLAPRRPSRAPPD